MNIPPEAWPPIAKALPRPWPEQAALLDLAWHHATGEPAQADVLVRRWGWAMVRDVRTTMEVFNALEGPWQLPPPHPPLTPRVPPLKGGHTAPHGGECDTQQQELAGCPPVDSSRPTATTAAVGRPTRGERWRGRRKAAFDLWADQMLPLLLAQGYPATDLLQREVSALAKRVGEHTAEGVLAGWTWLLTSPHDRARFLRSKGLATPGWFTRPTQCADTVRQAAAPQATEAPQDPDFGRRAADYLGRMASQRGRRDPPGGTWQLAPKKPALDAVLMAALADVGGWRAWCMADDFQRRQLGKRFAALVEQLWTDHNNQHRRAAK